MEGLPPLEEHIQTKYGLARRCQHWDPEKGQCKGVALKGELFCRHHLPGGKPPKKPQSGREGAKDAGKTPLEAHPPAPPPRYVHGLYSEAAGRSIREIAEEILRLEGELDNTDRELAILKGALVWLLDQAQAWQEKARELDRILEGLASLSPEKPEELRMVAEALRQGARLQEGIASWTDRLMEAAMRVINAAKQRAETRAKLAEARALEQFVKLTQAVRDILWDLVPEDVLNAFEERLQREVLEAHRLALPPRAEA